MKHFNAQLIIVFHLLASYSLTPAFPTQSKWGNFLGNMMKERTSKQSRPSTNNSNPTVGPDYGNIGPRRPSNNNDDRIYTLSEMQAHNYIEECIAALDFSLRPGIQDKDLKELAYYIKSSVEQGHNVYRHTSLGKKYSKNKVDEYINSGILHYIEQVSYHYALEQTNNTTVARKIAESMRNNAHARIYRNNTLDAEVLTIFVGDSLQRAVRESINRFDVPTQQDYRPNTNSSSNSYSRPTAASSDASSGYAPSANTGTAYAPNADAGRTFPTPDCPVCMESFESATRLFLTPCGHNMCKTCAYNWCYTESKSTCPICRASINRQKLAEQF